MKQVFQNGGSDNRTHLPTYSVIIPVHGDGKFLVDAVHSALCQSHEPIEVILVNDAAGSRATKTMSDLRTCDERVCIVNTSEHCGAGPARNIGMEYASGEYVAFLDSDDMWVATKMAEQLTSMRDCGALLGATQYGTIKAGRSIGSPRKNGTGWVDLNWLLVDNPIGTSSVTVHRTVELQFSKLSRCQDWAAWIELSKAGHVCWIVNKVLVYHRVGHSPRRLLSIKLRQVPYRWRVLRGTAKRGLLSSARLLSMSAVFAGLQMLRLEFSKAGL